MVRRAASGLFLFSVAAVGCGGGEATSGSRRTSLSDDELAAFGARPDGAEQGAAAARAPAAGGEAEAEAIELVGGERLEALVALVRFEAGQGEAPRCALYALRSTDRGLVEGRRSVDCGVVDPTAEIPLAPVEPARVPELRRALRGARLSPHADAVGAPVRLWLTTDQRSLDGWAVAARWPSPAADVVVPPIARAPANLSELWEAAMFPERYRP